MKTVDNDDAQGNSNSRSGFNSYMSYSYCYLGDARKQACSTSSIYQYQWIYGSSVNASGNSMTATLSVYLNHNDFTDPAAKYYINSGANSMETTLACTINQHTAPGGWTTYKAVTLPANAMFDANISRFVALETSARSSSYETGADGIRCRYTW